MRIAEATDADLAAVLHVQRAAFAREDEARLVAELLRDPTAAPCLSLLASEGERPVGHVLFTRVTLLGAAREVAARILAPLAVRPEQQRRGVGRALIEHGARMLAESGVELVFVLGDPAYYGRHGFVPAIPSGLHAPYPIDPEEAWRVRPFAPGVLGSVAGTAACAASLAPEEYWRE